MYRYDDIVDQSGIEAFTHELTAAHEPEILALSRAKLQHDFGRSPRGRNGIRRYDTQRVATCEYDDFAFRIGPLRKRQRCLVRAPAQQHRIDPREKRFVAVVAIVKPPRDVAIARRNVTVETRRDKELKTTHALASSSPFRVSLRDAGLWAWRRWP